MSDQITDLGLEALQELIPIFKLELAPELDAKKIRRLMYDSRKPLDKDSVIAVDDTGLRFAAFRKGKPVVINT